MSDMNRFIMAGEQEVGGLKMKILIDKRTGVYYLFCVQGWQAAGLTVMLDANGKPVTSDYSVSI